VAFVLDEGGVARQRDLELVRPVGEGFLVGGGLAPGEVLITGPLERVEDGAPCVRRESDAGAAGAEADAR
jgi:hypothetical protein